MKNINERDQSKGYIPLRLIIRDNMIEKQFKNLDEQIDIFRNKGMIITNESRLTIRNLSAASRLFLFKGKQISFEARL